MSRNHNVILNIEALGALPISGKRRELVLSFIRDLAWSSHICGDVSFQDELSLRPYELNVVAGFAITWWIDAAVNEVRVVDIRPSS